MIEDKVIFNLLAASYLYPQQKAIASFYNLENCDYSEVISADADTLKAFAMLHHGSLKEPRLPVPIYGSDRIAYRRLQGISPGALNGDRQFWL